MQVHPRHPPYGKGHSPRTPPPYKAPREHRNPLHRKGYSTHHSAQPQHQQTHKHTLANPYATRLSAFTKPLNDKRSQGARRRSQTLT